MGISGKIFASALLLALLAVQSGGAQAQCAPPACRQPGTPTTGTPTTGTPTKGSSGGGVGVQIDVGDAAKAIGGLFKKKKKPVEQPVEIATPVEQAKPEIVFTKSNPVVQTIPGSVRKPPVIVKPKAPPAPRKIAAPVAATAAIAAPMFEPEAEAAPIAEIAQPEAPVAKAATITPAVDTPEPDASLYWIIAAVLAALAAAGTAAKLLLTPKVAMNCDIADGTSRMVSNPSLSTPEVSFDVVIPGFSASPPDNLRILA